MSLVVLPRQMLADINGAPRVAATLGFYQAGTATPITIYTTSAYGPTHTNPVASVSNGFFPAVYVNPSVNATFKMVAKDALGTTIWTEDDVPALGFSSSDISSVLYPLNAAEQVAVVTPSSYLFDYGNVKRYGAALTNTSAQNLTALNKAISVAAAATGAASLGGQVITVPSDCHYGCKTTDSTTWPVMSGTVPITIYDYSQGETSAGFPAAYDGMQVRIWMYTPQTTVLGQHDGNTCWQRAAWAPNYVISNDMNLTGARLASDNRRAYSSYGFLGLVGWSAGQGSLSSSTATNEELSNYCIIKHHITGDTLGDYSPLIVERKTGNWSMGGGTNTPGASVHIKSVVTGFYQMLIESLTTTSQVYWRTSNGSGDDAGIRNVAGDLSLNIVAQGDALTVSKTNRRVKTNQSFQQMAQTLTYSASMTIDAATGNIFTTTATNGTAMTFNAPTNPATGIKLRLRIRNASGGVLGAATFNAVFKMPAWTQPANGFSRTVEWDYDGTNWVEAFRSAADVPN